MFAEELTPRSIFVCRRADSSEEGLFAEELTPRGIFICRRADSLEEGLFAEEMTPRARMTHSTIVRRRVCAKLLNLEWVTDQVDLERVADQVESERVADQAGVNPGDADDRPAYAMVYIPTPGAPGAPGALGAPGVTPERAADQVIEHMCILLHENNHKPPRVPTLPGSRNPVGRWW